MPAFLLSLLKYVPFLGGLFEKWTENKNRTAEINAEKELIEAKAFSKGRISPKYMLKYALVVVFMLFCISMMLHVMFAQYFPISPLQGLDPVFKLAINLLEAGWW